MEDLLNAETARDPKTLSSESRKKNERHRDE